MLCAISIVLVVLVKVVLLFFFINTVIIILHIVIFFYFTFVEENIINILYGNFDLFKTILIYMDLIDCLPKQYLQPLKTNIQ